MNQRPEHRPDRGLRLPAVLQLVSVSKSTLYAWIAAGYFPKPLKFGNRVVMWMESEVVAWIQRGGQQR